VHHESHVSARTGWLRAGVLGANDGLLSTASLIVGVAAADVSRSVLFAAGLAALLAGAFSMAVGEYSSVSSQRDAEEADLAKERSELAESPRSELVELQGIYVRRGLEPGLARQVAEQLTAHDALASHARDELGLDPGQLARPVQAATTSALSFSVGALVPLITVMVASTRWRIPACVVVTLVCLGVLGAVGAEIGGASKPRASLRVLIGGAAAMAITYAIGHAVGVNV
jgi:VIT1/CCC1 family predicted Fe2+/Mn2+ transporter